MPELPDVAYFKQYMDATSLHQEIGSVEVRDSEVLGEISAEDLVSVLEGRAFAGTRRHGKYLFAHVDKGPWLVLHFGMTGFLKYSSSPEILDHTRVLFRFAEEYHLEYVNQRRLGTVDITSDVEVFVTEKQLGIDARPVSYPISRMRSPSLGLSDSRPERRIGPLYWPCPIQPHGASPHARRYLRQFDARGGEHCAEASVQNLQ